MLTLVASLLVVVSIALAQPPAEEPAPSVDAASEEAAPAEAQPDTSADEQAADDSATTDSATSDPAPAEESDPEPSPEPEPQPETGATPATTTDEPSPDAVGASPLVESSDSELGGEGADDDPATAPAAPSASTTPAVTAGEEQDGLSPALLAILVVAIIVVPVLVGNYASKKLNMPDHGWKIATVLGTALAGAAICYLGEFKLGPDLGGGVTLIYELEDGELVESEETSGDEGDEAVEGNKRGKVDIDKMIGALKKRVDPSGTKEVVIRPYGNAIEIIIPKAGGAELDVIKNTITRLGELEFRITVDRTRANETGVRGIIEAAEALPPTQKIVRLGDRPVAEWVRYKESQFGTLDESSRQGLVKRAGLRGPEALVRIDDGLDVTGQYLTNAIKAVGDDGWEVRFDFDAMGATRFEKLTGRNLPTPGSGRQHFLGIILDKELLSAPGINSKISGSGTISGGMTEQEVTEVVNVLDAGSLPAALNSVPVSEEVVSAGIGAATITQATNAMLVSMLLVVAFMMLYYRFAGVVAVLALALNVLLVLGIMVLIGAAFTLPGLAGLVLTVGMSVDANVLIFERIREEMNRGASLRMAIRNGFARATTTIIDANVTTLIVGVVLYTIGTDQIKGFAVTLVLGIVMSMYTAIFCSRLAFDIAERRGWLKTLHMSRLIGDPGINFLGIATPCIAVSVACIVVGLFGVYQRGNGIFDIDFTGGTSVTLAFDEGQAMEFRDVRKKLEQSELGSQNLQVVQRGIDALSYTVDSAEQSVEAVQQIIAKTFGERLATYELNVKDITPFESDGLSGTQATLAFGEKGNDITATSYDTVAARLEAALAATGFTGVVPIIANEEYTTGSSQRFNLWEVKLGLDPSAAQQVFDNMQSNMNSSPVFPLANKIGPRVAGDLKETALYAIGVSLLGIVAYIWIRFQKLSYGIAAVIALIHDVLFALGIVATSAWLADAVPALATSLQIDAFQLSLPIVAAFLTIIGYSLNDTIVVFDRIREVRGKSPRLSAEMINNSINQTLSRTLLTSLTTLIVVAILFWFGGSGVHGFAFTLLVGIVVGTYSSICIASPALLWLEGLESPAPSGSGSTAKKVTTQKPMGGAETAK